MSAPLLVSLVPERFEDGAWSGVPRFDYELRAILPGLVSRKDDLRTRLWLRWLARRRPDTIVITGNEMSLLVPDALRTIVVHHGCAQTHFDRDTEWRGRAPEALCRAQRTMYTRPNRFYVAPSRWAAEQFARHYDVPEPVVLPFWVEPIARTDEPHERKVVLGDFRNHNKGARAASMLAREVPELELRPLSCTYQTRATVYSRADAYVCLSLSEGGSYALADAEAAALPIVTTDVGNCHELTYAVVIRWQDRDDAKLLASALRRALTTPRGPSFFTSYTRDDWRRGWQELLARVQASPGCPALRHG